MNTSVGQQQGRSRSAFATRRTARLEWMRAHPSFWAGLPSEKEDVSDAQSAGLRQLAQTMIEAGLFSAKGDKADVRWSIRLLIGTLTS